MCTIASIHSESWNTFLREAIETSKHVGMDQNGLIVLIEKNSPSTKKSHKKLSLVDIFDISSRFQKEQPEIVVQIAASLKIIATASEAKRYAGVWKINKIFSIVINGLLGRQFVTTETKLCILAENMLKKATVVSIPPIQQDILFQNNLNQECSDAERFKIEPEKTPPLYIGDVFSCLKTECSSQEEPILPRCSGLDTSVAIVVYKKGLVKTRSIIPTVKKIDGGQLGVGKFGNVYVHRNDPQLAVKKRMGDQTKLYEFACQLQHRCIVSTKKLFIKTYSDGQKKSKIVMEKIDGMTLNFYYLQVNKKKLSDKTTTQLLLDAKETVRYLFENKIVWADVNDGNIFATLEGHLKLCDFDFWEKEENSFIRTQKLLLGAMELVGWIIKSSNIRLSGKNEEKEKDIIRPSEFFTVPCDTPIIYTAHAAIGHMHYQYCKLHWMEAISKEIMAMDEKDRIMVVERYFDCVIANFSKLAVKW